MATASKTFEEADVAAGSFSHFRPTNVGFGLYYTLPIIAEIVALAAAIARGDIQETMILIENPEAHLHPAGQTKMGIFLALACSCGIQCLVETHSEHILNGIRIAIKEKKIVPEDVVFYFFSKIAGQDEAEVTAIFSDETGLLDKWPRGFQDEAENALMRLM